MKKQSWIALAVIVVLAVALVVLQTAGKQRVSDETQIRAVLAEVASGIEKRDIGRVMSHVSRAYADDAGNNYQRLRVEIYRALRRRGQYEVMAPVQASEIVGDTAHVQVEAFVTARSQSGRRQIFRGILDVELRREKARRWVVLPSTAWKIAGFSMPDVSDWG